MFVCQCVRGAHWEWRGCAQVPLHKTVVKREEANSWLTKSFHRLVLDSPPHFLNTHFISSLFPLLSLALLFLKS